MKKIFLATCLLAASVFAAPQAAAPAKDAKAAAPAAAPAKDAKAATPAAAPAKDAKAATPAAAPAKDAKAAAPAAAPAKDAKAAAPAAAPAKDAKAEAAPAPAAAPAAAPAKDAKAEAAPAPAAAPAAAPAKDAKAEAAPAPAAAPAAAPAQEAKAEAAPADSASAAAAPVDSAAQAAAPVAAPVDSAKAEPAAEVAAKDSSKTVSEETIAANTDEQGFISAPEQKAEPKKKKRRKKKKLVENAVISTDKAEFGILADFELSAEKVFWSSEDDKNNDNLETWQGEANFAILAEGDNFKGKLAIAFYPGDLKDEIFGDKDAKQQALRDNENGKLSDYFSLDEAWAYQGNDVFSFKVGRWDNTDKNGDYFGGYIDGYLAGFLSTQNPENQFQFGFSPNDNMDFTIGFISKAVNLDNGDLRAAFNFHGLEGIHDLNIQLAYRSNLFDKVYDSDSKVIHNASLKANLPIIKNTISIFAESALLNLSGENVSKNANAKDEDLIIPVTGGVIIQTPVVDRIILEAEYIGDRNEHPQYWSVENPKHVKDVLGAIYLEKAFTDRFSLSAGFHSYGATKDFMLSGNLIGRIN